MIKKSNEEKKISIEEKNAIGGCYFQKKTGEDNQNWKKKKKIQNYSKSEDILKIEENLRKEFIQNIPKEKEKRFNLFLFKKLN